MKSVLIIIIKVIAALVLFAAWCAMVVAQFLFLKWLVGTTLAIIFYVIVAIAAFAIPFIQYQKFSTVKLRLTRP